MPPIINIAVHVWAVGINHYDNGQVLANPHLLAIPFLPLRYVRNPFNIHSMG